MHDSQKALHIKCYLFRGSISQASEISQASRRSSHISEAAVSSLPGSGTVSRRRSIVTSESQDDAWTGDECSSIASSKHPSISYPVSFQVKLNEIESEC